MARTITGNLTMLGNAQITGNGVHHYSLIEIGGQVLRKVRCPSGVNNFLMRALDMPGETTLYLNGSFLFAVRLPDGRAYTWKTSSFGSVLVLLFGICTIPIFGIGLIFIFIALKELSVHSDASSLIAQGAIRV